MIFETKCKRCGHTVCFLSKSQWGWKIGDDIFCGYSCKNAELSEQETKERKRVETTFEKKKEYEKAYKALKCRSEQQKKAKPYTHKPKKGNYRTRAVLKIDAFDGRVVKKYPSVREASMQEFMTKSALSRRINGKHKRAEEYIWRYEDEYEGKAD